jgi:hypothetical protein
MRRFLVLLLLSAGALIASSAVVSAPSRGRLAELSGSAWAAAR